MAMCARHEIEYGRPSDDCSGCDTDGAEPTSQTHQIGKLPDGVWDRYCDLREESRGRMDADEHGVRVGTARRLRAPSGGRGGDGR